MVWQNGHRKDAKKIRTLFTTTTDHRTTTKMVGVLRRLKYTFRPHAFASFFLSSLSLLSFILEGRPRAHLVHSSYLREKLFAEQTARRERETFSRASACAPPTIIFGRAHWGGGDEVEEKEKENKDDDGNGDTERCGHVPNERTNGRTKNCNATARCAITP